MDWLGDILDGLFDIIQSALEAVLNAFLGKVLYFIETALCKILALLDQMFQIFAGITKVTYDGSKDYLINIFFRNQSISNVYWGMALIGIAMAFGFAVAAVVKKLFDSSNRMQTSLGQIITALIRSMFLILGMSAIMVIVINSTNVLMQQINYLFSDPENLDLPETIVYTDEEYAAMGRVLNTIGNYSLNPSYSSRYNLNSCFNDIRRDLYYLQQRNVFRYYYATKDADGNALNTWQSVLQAVAKSHDLRTDLKLDVSYDSVTTALISAMDIIRNDAAFKPLESYTRVVPENGLLAVDRYVFLMGTMHAAKNSEYNSNPGLTDAVRGPYYTGERSIYNYDQVTNDFDIGFATDYLVVYLSCFALIVDYVTIILNCIARIFNMLFLYIIAPPIFATQPLDGGGKTKQWMTAFIVQAFSVFGTVIAMRLLLILLPIVTSSSLVLFENALANTMAKLVLIYGLFEVSKKATGLLTGILADSAGWQSIQAGDMSSSAGKLTGAVGGAAKAVAGGAAKLAGKAALKVGDVATKPLQNVAKRGWEASGGKVAKAWSELGSDKAGQERREAEESAKKNMAVRAAEERLFTPHTAEQFERMGVNTKGATPIGGGSDGGNGGQQNGLPNNAQGSAQPSAPQGGQQGSAPQKEPPPLPNKQGGAQKPLSPQAQKLFGTDASGKVKAGGGASIPKAPSPPPTPGTRDAELASKAAAHPRPKVDAQGDMMKSKGNGVYESPNAPKAPPSPPPVPQGGDLPSNQNGKK